MKTYGFVVTVNGDKMDQFPTSSMKWNCIASAMTFMWHTEAKKALDSNPGGVAKELFDWGEFSYGTVRVKIVEKEIKEEF